MKLNLSELEQIISEEIDAVITPAVLSPLERYILNEQAAGFSYSNPANLLKEFTKTPKPKRRRRRRRSKAKRQAILLKRINKDKSGKSKGSNITIKDLQTALASIPVSAKFAKAATPGKYDRNTYRAIASFQRKYRSELADNRVDGLVGPNTAGVLRKYDKSGVFSKKLDTKGTTIAGTAKLLKGFDKIVDAKPGKARQDAMVKLALSQPEAYMSQLRKLEKELRVKPGVAKLGEQENIIEPTDMNYKAKARQSTAPGFSGLDPSGPKLSAAELASSKKVALLRDMKSALAQATRLAIRNKEKQPKVFQAFLAAAKKTKQVGVARQLEPNYVSDAELKSAMSERRVTGIVNALEKEMDSNFGSGKSEAFLKQLEKSKAIYKNKVVPALGAAYFIFGKRRGQTLIQWLQDERALKDYWPSVTQEAMKEVKNAPPVPAATKKAQPDQKGAEKKAAKKGTTKKTVNASKLINQFPKNTELVGKSTTVNLGNSKATFTFKKNGMSITPIGGDYKFTSSGVELNVDSVKVAATGDSVTMEMSFMKVGGKATFDDKKLLNILNTLFSGKTAAVAVGRAVIMISKR